ncbi:MAG: hypothetical protein NC124_07665 [Clostridium sp.]|nr:hypothetical protein [Clostridium sp.]
MIKKILKSILVYMVFYILDIFMFSCLLYEHRYNLDISFGDFLYFQFINNNIEMRSSIMIGVFYFAQNIIEVSAVAILTSYIFAYILNREPRIIFPDKLVIRHRTSWEAQNKLTLGILIGNRNHYEIHNVVCAITCSYIKQESPLLINSEFTLTEERISLENFYRFSFDLAKFPRQVLKDIIERPTYFDEETIVVSITGNCNYIGNSFKISKKYKLSDIVYDEHTPVLSQIRTNKYTGKNLVNPFTKSVMKRINWSELKRIVEVNEDKRSATVKEIKYIIKKKKTIK